MFLSALIYLKAVPSFWAWFQIKWICVAALSGQSSLGPSKVFFSSHLHFCRMSASCPLPMLQAPVQMDHTAYPLLRDLSSKTTTTKTELPICCPLTLFLEKQRNENKCHPSQMYIREPALFSVLLTKHQCRQESFMTIIGRTIVEHTSLSASGAISYALRKDLKG